jgi:hypothetical protein
VNKSIHRLRRWVVTAMAATTMLSTGVILASAGPAGAVFDTGSISAESTPTIISQAVQATNDQPVGNLDLTIPLARCSTTTASST